MKNTARLLACLAVIICASAADAQEPQPSPRVTALLRAMTLEEKAGQLNLLSGHNAVTGPYATPDVESAIKQGTVGGLFNVYGAAYTRNLQELTLAHSRLKIPLLLGFDVLHGYRTIFPTPLAQAASFNPELIEQAERAAAREAAAAGVNWVYAPMLDVARDPRWGRMVEGAGESPWYAALIAQARVKGLQGETLSDPAHVLACAKHFAGNGAVEGGRDYSATDLSLRALRDQELPPFKAAAQSGIGCFMAAFNAPDGTPGITNRFLLDDVLRKEWGFHGLVVSDFGAMLELPVHGVAQDLSDSASKALLAGTDMDMQARAFVAHLPQLVTTGRVSSDALDRAVTRVLMMKEKLGLFDDPFARSDVEREATVIEHPDHLALSRQLAEESTVLLKNKDGILPLDPHAPQRIALIGPLSDAKADTMGPWPAHGDPAHVVTLRTAMQKSVKHLAFAAGGQIEQASDQEIAKAVATARRSDVVILALGERATMSGEAASRAQPDLPGRQRELLLKITALGKPVIVVLLAGRPIIDPVLYDKAMAVLLAWQPGSQGGDALKRILWGEAEPLGHLPVTIPRQVGQIPITHDRRPTGRPATPDNKPYTTGYSDLSLTPQYPFGFGLSYAPFSLDTPTVSLQGDANKPDALVIETPVHNQGKRRSTTLVQVYTRQDVAAVSQPEKQLRGFARITLERGASGVAKINIPLESLIYHDGAGTAHAPAGTLTIMAGLNAQETQQVKITLPPAR